MPSLASSRAVVRGAFLVSLAIAWLVTLFVAAALAEPSLVAIPAGEQVLTIPLGPWIMAFETAFFQIFAPIAVTLICGFVYTKYPWLKGIVTEKVITDQVNQGLAYAQNATANATKDMRFDVPVGKTVLGTAAAQILVKANTNVVASRAVKWAGGPEAIAKRVFSAMHLSHEASAENVLVPVLRQIEAGTLVPEKIGSLQVVVPKPGPAPKPKKIVPKKK